MENIIYGVLSYSSTYIGVARGVVVPSDDRRCESSWIIELRGSGNGKGRKEGSWSEPFERRRRPTFPWIDRNERLTGRLQVIVSVFKVIPARATCMYVILMTSMNLQLLLPDDIGKVLRASPFFNVIL